MTVKNQIDESDAFQLFVQEVVLSDNERSSVNGILVRIELGVAFLNLIHRRFAPEWLKLKRLYPELAGREWKQWWAVTEADRLRLRIEIDALWADLYGLDPDDFDWIVRDDPSDPKGFYRVDRQLPFPGAAHRPGRGGVPCPEGRPLVRRVRRLTRQRRVLRDPLHPRADQRPGRPRPRSPGPLIEKRAGCHTWRPESFPADDPRHGWTWDDCWNDAVALLGSEEAVRSYIEAETKPTKPDEGDGDGPFLLRGDWQSPKQGKLF